MSLENAILELAAALKEQAAAQRDIAAATREGNQGYRDAVVAYAANAGSQVDLSMAEPSKPSKPSAEAQEEREKHEMSGAQDDELETAVQKVEDAAIAEQPADLDYAKDVRPVLLAAIKKSGKPAMESLLAKFGVLKADQLQAKDFAAVLVEARKLAA